MTTVFVLIMHTYNDFGAKINTSVAGIYATKELAESIAGNILENKVETFEEYIASNSNEIQNMSQEDQEIMYSNHVYTMTEDYSPIKYNIEEHTLKGE